MLAFMSEVSCSSNREWKRTQTNICSYIIIFHASKCSSTLAKSWKALKHCRISPNGNKSVARARPLYCNCRGYLESYFHSLLLPLNFRSISSPAEFSESFQELGAQHEFKCSTGFNSNHLAGTSPFCFGKRFHELFLGNSSLFCSCWNKTSPLKEGNYFKPLTTAMEHSTAVHCPKWCTRAVLFQSSFSFSAHSTITA